MQEQKYTELEERSSESLNQREIRLIKAELYDQVRKLEANSIIHQEIEQMRAEGKALTLSDEELKLLESFRRFKLRMREDVEVFTWKTRKPEGVQLVTDTAELIAPEQA